MAERIPGGNRQVRRLHQEGVQRAVQKGDQVAADIPRAGRFALDLQESAARASNLDLGYPKKIFGVY